VVFSDFKEGLEQLEPTYLATSEGVAGIDPAG